MGNSSTSSNPIRTVSKRKRSKALPIETIFKLPSPTPSWPQQKGFGSGTIDLGEIQVREVRTFKRVWASHEGGPGNSGSSFFEPDPIPDGFHILGFYAQPNNTPLFGSALVAATSSPKALAEPVDYKLAWTSEPTKIKRDGDAYFWLPIPPEGYKAAGIFVTSSPEKPSPGKLRCVRADLTEPCEGEPGAPIWGFEGFSVLALRPVERGSGAPGVPAGTFSIATGTISACLKNKSSSSETISSPEIVETLMKTYSPVIHFHRDEKFLPSSVSWYFENGARLVKRGEESNPVRVDPPEGSNLPTGGSNDGEYWLDLPGEKAERERVKRGDLNSAKVYLHAKPMMGGTRTDLAAWIFYPFNGPAKAKVGLINVPLGRVGEHIGDWEHVTLRISNFSGELERMYFSQHSKGVWVDAPEIEYFPGTNKPVAYSSLNGHANYPKAGLVLQGSGGFGIRNDAAKGKALLDTGAAFELVAGAAPATVEPPWLHYMRKWGPKIEYDTRKELEGVAKVLIGPLKKAFNKMVNGLPSEIFGEDGPTGPKLKSSWSGDEPY